jgi:hypothetical protein
MSRSLTSVYRASQAHNDLIGNRLEDAENSKRRGGHGVNAGEEFLNGLRAEARSNAVFAICAQALTLN